MHFVSRENIKLIVYISKECQKFYQAYWAVLKGSPEIKTASQRSQSIQCYNGHVISVSSVTYYELKRHLTHLTEYKGALSHFGSHLILTQLFGIKG